MSTTIKKHKKSKLKLVCTQYGCSYRIITLIDNIPTKFITFNTLTPEIKRFLDSKNIPFIDYKHIKF